MRSKDDNENETDNILKNKEAAIGPITSVSASAPLKAPNPAPKPTGTLAPATSNVAALLFPISSLPVIFAALANRLLPDNANVLVLPMIVGLANVLLVK